MSRSRIHRSTFSDWSVVLSTFNSTINRLTAREARMPPVDYDELEKSRLTLPLKSFDCSGRWPRAMITLLFTSPLSLWADVIRSALHRRPPTILRDQQTAMMHDRLWTTGTTRRQPTCYCFVYISVNRGTPLKATPAGCRCAAACSAVILPRRTKCPPPGTVLTTIGRCLTRLPASSACLRCCLTYPARRQSLRPLVCVGCAVNSWIMFCAVARYCSVSASQLG